MSVATSDKPQVNDNARDVNREQKAGKVDNAHAEVFDHTALPAWKEAAGKSAPINDGFAVVDPTKAKAGTGDPPKTAGEEPLKPPGADPPQKKPGDQTQLKPDDPTQLKPDDRNPNQVQPGQEVTWTTSVGADGTKVQQGSDGTVIQTFQDGTVITTTRDPSSGDQTIAVNKPDGTMMVTGKDDQGRMATTTITPDGQVACTNPDGTPLAASAGSDSGIVTAGGDPLVSGPGGTGSVATGDQTQPLDDSGQPIVAQPINYDALGTTLDATQTANTLPPLDNNTPADQVNTALDQASQACTLAEDAVAKAAALGEKGQFMLARALDDLVKAEKQLREATIQQGKDHQMTDEQKKRLFAKVDKALSSEEAAA